MEDNDCLLICKKIAAILVRRINTGVEAFNRVDYTNVAEELDYDGITNMSISKYLGHLSVYCINIELPPISAIVKNRNDNLPGKRYFEIFTQNLRNTYKGLRQYVNQLEMIMNTNWDRLLIQLDEDSKNIEFDITSLQVNPEILNSFGL